MSKQTSQPFLTHVTRHHGQFTLVPPDNQGRIRKTRGATATTTRTIVRPLNSSSIANMEKEVVNVSTLSRSSTTRPEYGHAMLSPVPRDNSGDHAAVPSSIPSGVPDEIETLLARIDEDPRYEDLLLLSDVIGPAESVPTSIDALDLPIGQIEMERRRMTKDGRVKLKLRLFGMSVDRCGICISQFKHAESAVALQPCLHSFHLSCVTPWLKRSSTCPMCRHSLIKSTT